MTSAPPPFRPTPGTGVGAGVAAEVRKDLRPELQRASLDLSRRDLTLDLARVVCVLLVVVIHLLEAGVGRDAAGGLVVSRPLETQWWFTGVTWVGQIMPLFFVVGGFASRTAYRSHRRRGGNAAGYVTSRILRLAQPALPLFLFYAVVIGTTTWIVPVPPELLSAVVIGAGSPLWFLAAYGICQALVPLLTLGHERAPRATLLVLLAAVIVVDAARYATDLKWLGLVNMLFVWPLVQQIGFWYADGWFDRRRPWQLVLLIVGGVAALAPLTLAGPYDTNMLADLNPPTLPLVALGISQAAFLRLLRRPLAALMRTRPAKTVVFLVGSRLMTIYLWHLPIIVILSGVGLLIPGASPAPESVAWWASRPLVYLLVLVALFGLSFLVGRWEQPRELGATPPVGVVAAAVVLVVTPNVLLIPGGLDLWIAIAGSVALGIAVVALGRWRSGRAAPATAR